MLATINNLRVLSLRRRPNGKSAKCLGPCRAQHRPLPASKMRRKKRRNWKKLLQLFLNKMGGLVPSPRCCYDGRKAQPLFGTMTPLSRYCYRPSSDSFFEFQNLSSIQQRRQTASMSDDRWTDRQDHMGLDFLLATVENSLAWFVLFLHTRFSRFLPLSRRA